MACTHDHNVVMENGEPRVSLSRRDIIRGIAAGTLVAVAPGCAYNEELGRNQFLMVGGEQMAQLASASWSQLKQQQRISRDPRYTQRMARVAPKIIRAAGGNPAQWEVVVFESKDLNAFALPGGKIGFYTGIMDLMDNDAQIATVMGHEVAHVKYNHSGERYSQSSVASLGMAAAQVALADRASNERAQILGVLGMGATLGVILPFSRKHELEADKFGVRYMATAGYDPRESIEFWVKMARSGGAKPPEIMSTHPADNTRIKQLQDEIKAMGYA